MVSHVRYRPVMSRRIAPKPQGTPRSGLGLAFRYAERDSAGLRSSVYRLHTVSCRVEALLARFALWIKAFELDREQDHQDERLQGARTQGNQPAAELVIPHRVLLPSWEAAAQVV